MGLGCGSNGLITLELMFFTIWYEYHEIDNSDGFWYFWFSYQITHKFSAPLPLPFRNHLKIIIFEKLGSFERASKNTKIHTRIVDQRCLVAKIVGTQDGFPKLIIPQFDQLVYQ